MKRLSIVLVVAFMLSLFTVTASAASFTKSVSRKPAPEVVDSGSGASDLTVQSLAEADEDSALVAAYKDLQSTNLKVAGIDDANKLAVSDLFAIAPNGEDEGKAVTATFKSDLASKDGFVVMQYVNNKWTKVADSDVVVNDDGTVTTTFGSYGPVAFALEEIANTDSPVDSAVNSTAVVFLAASVVCAAVAVVFVVAAKKKAAEA